MTPESRWQRVQALCAEIEPLPAADQEAALALEPDPEVREQARQLLRALAAEALARAEASPRPAAFLPPAIGDYAVTALLGEGGTSTVYAAERAGQPVAVKVLHAYLNTPESVQRFRREQSILARLDHPGICRVLDAGLTPGQQPFLVLDRVDGLPIDQFCNARGLDLAARIRLVISACEAVAAAHRSLVVHLDLKPGNILVTPAGHVRLLDFGTAKLLDPAGSLTTTRHLTPLYASPEQLRGEPVTTACDIYGLGVILFELLAGAGPYRAASIVSVAERAAGAAAPVSLADQASEAAARQRGLSLDALRRQLRGDLETIVAKALAPEPDRRYATALDLAADLRRYLDGHPVLARKQTALYRIQKYALRNRGAVTLTALLVVGLAGSLAYAAWQQHRALVEARRASAVGRFLGWMVFSSNPNYAGRANMTVLELVERAAAKLDRGDLPDPILTAELESSFANVLFQGGQPTQGVAVARRAFDRARQTGDSAAIVEAGEVLGTILLSLGDCPGASGVYAEADARFQRDRRRLNLVTQAGFLVSRDQVLANCAGDSSGALTAEAAAIARRISDTSTDSHVPPRLFKGLVFNAHIRALTRQRRFPEALAVSDEAIRLVAAEPDGRSTHVALLQSKAAAEYGAGDKAAAARTLEQAVDLAANHAAPFEAIRLHVMAGQRLAEAGQPDKAVRLAERALALAETHRSELAATRWMILIDAAITFFRANQCARVKPLVDEADQLTGGRMPPQWKGNRLAVEAFCLDGDAARRKAREALDAAGSAFGPSSGFRKRLEAIAAPPR